MSLSLDILKNSSRGIDSCCCSIKLSKPAEDEEYCSSFKLPLFFDSVLLTFVILDDFSANAAAVIKQLRPIQTFIILYIESFRSPIVTANSCHDVMYVPGRSGGTFERVDKRENFDGHTK